MSGTPSTGELLFRVAHEEDLDAIIALLTDDDLGQQRESNIPEDRPRYETAFAAISADANNEIIVADMAGQVVGCAQLTMLPGLTYTGGTRAQIEGVRVASDRRGQSIGKKMFTFIIERARASGVIMVQLTMASTRTDTARFYKDLGFVATHSGFKLKF